MKVQECNLVRFMIKSQYSGTCISLVALEVDEICEDILIRPSEQYYPSFQLADSSAVADEIEKGICILIGSDNYWNVASGEIERITSNLSAIKTIFGWTLQGPSLDPREVTTLSTVVLHSHFDESFNEKYFWDLDVIGINNESDTNQIIDFSKYVRKNGMRYKAKLLWRDTDSKLDNYREGAYLRFQNLIRKLSRESYRLFEYEQTMNEFLSSGFAERVNEPPKCGIRSYYLPHRAVYREDKTTSKIRIVFDASARRGNNASLNSLLSPGPNLLPDVFHILLNFRCGQIGLVADIKKAFLQIELADEDKDVHRFFWFESKIKDIGHLPAIAEFRMNRVTFGVACSPFLLSATIRTHLEEKHEIHPDTCEILRNSFYMDDFICSTNDEHEAERIYFESIAIMKQASMELRKWNSNYPKIKALFDKLEPPPEMQKVLGLKWYTVSDELSVDLDQLLSSPSQVRYGTKRELLSIISKIYDPLGTIAPFAVKLKILFQETWKRKLKWDDILPSDLTKTFASCISEFPQLKDINLPRSTCDYSNIASQELHFFADASTKAYGVVVYLKSVSRSGEVVVKYVCSKSRIAPLKEDRSSELTLPKLELTAAVIAVRLYTYLKNNLRLKFESVHFWSDSQITLAWIKGDYRKWKPYVSNRVREIIENSKPQNWRHCSGKSNPADILTRGISSKELMETASWLGGPEWLKNQYIDNYTKLSAEELGQYSPLTMTCLAAFNKVENVKIIPVLEMKAYSDYRKLLRITAYIFRFKARVKKTGIPLNKFLLAHELENAEEYWIRFVQQQEYADEIASLRNKGLVDKSSSILNLNPKLDRLGILRLGSRLSEALSQENLYEGLHNPFPIIIPKHSYLANLLIIDVHKQRAHAGVNLLLAELRRKFWIPKARQLIKSLVSSCVTCRRMRGKPATQPIAPLRLNRIDACRPFQTTGIDFAGPLYVKTAEGSTRKFYCMLFTCSTIRAVHLELTPNLTTESCLIGVRRFIARRGAPEVIISDNAKSFKRAAKDVAVLGDVLKSEKLQGYVSNRNILWKFIVERAPWWGGFWERLIRSVKDVLKVTVERNTLTEEELTTLLVEAEDIVNSRPLTYISEDPLDLSPLTPAHFLKGHFPNPTDAGALRIGKDLQEKWSFRLRCTKFFWKRWRMEYITQLRSAHHIERKRAYEIKIGDVVLIHDDLTPRLFWKLAIVENVFPGRDGRVRSCELKISNGSKLRRPIQLLYPLETRRPEDVENIDVAKHH